MPVELRLRVLTDTIHAQHRPASGVSLTPTTRHALCGLFNPGAASQSLLLPLYCAYPLPRLQGRSCSCLSVSRFQTKALTARSLQNAGMSQTMAFNINLIGYLMFIVGTIIAWTCLYRFGRRRMYIASQVLMGILFGIIGVLGCLDNANSGSISTAIGVCMILITFAFNISVGPACEWRRFLSGLRSLG